MSLLVHFPVWLCFTSGCGRIHAEVSPGRRHDSQVSLAVLKPKCDAEGSGEFIANLLTEELRKLPGMMVMDRDEVHRRLSAQGVKEVAQSEDAPSAMGVALGVDAEVIIRLHQFGKLREGPRWFGGQFAGVVSFEACCVDVHKNEILWRINAADSRNDVEPTEVCRSLVHGCMRRLANKLARKS